MIVPCSAKGITDFQSVMQTATQSNLSSFHVAGQAEDPDEKLAVQKILDNSKMASFYMNVETIDSRGFREKNLFRKIGYYITGFAHYDFVAKNADLNLTGRNVVRFYFDYRKLIQDNRSLSYIEIVLRLKHCPSNIRITSDFIGIMDYEQGSQDSTHSIAMKIMGETIGIEGILEYSNGKVTGSNLEALSKADDVIKETMTSNNVQQVYNILGVEAARAVIYQEIGKGTIADYMTYYGVIDPYSKNSNSIQNKQFMTSMSFEKPIQDLQKVAIGKSIDNVEGVYSQLMLGRKPDIGSNSRQFHVFDA